MNGSIRTPCEAGIRRQWTASQATRYLVLLVSFNFHQMCGNKDKLS
jgi:hypothetical protein